MAPTLKNNFVIQKKIEGPMKTFIYLKAQLFPSSNHQFIPYFVFGFLRASSTKKRLTYVN